MQKTTSSSEFITSFPGILKLCAIILFILSSILFISLDLCVGTPKWYSSFYPTICIGATIIAVGFYAAFLLSIGKITFNRFCITDIVVSTILFLVTLTVGIMTVASCSNSVSLNYIPAPLGIVGSICLALSTIINFIHWKSEWEQQKEEFEQQEAARTTHEQQRNSVWA